MQSWDLYLRWEDGNLPIKINKDGTKYHYEVEGKSYPSLFALVGRKVSPQQYFGLADLSSPPTFFNLYDDLQQKIVVYGQQKPLTKTRLGIDFVAKYNDIRRLVIAGFGKRLLSANLDLEDAVQEVYKGLIIRDKGKCPWDPSKSSLGHYVHLCVRGILANHYRRERTKHKDVCYLEDIEHFEPSEIMDDSTLITLSSLKGKLESDTSEQGRLAKSLLPLLLEGQKKKDALQTLGWSNTKFNKVLQYLQRAVRGSQLFKA